ncbi:glycine cleavage system protein R [Microbaculum marinum]|uniref:ACT domain-containing protein n=1 Tax=Microbaculum marinum TaxID=1764581 RepID=A0AAW9RRB5_9HYPH
MSAEVVLSIVARDRPGLVQTLAERVAAHDGNWIDSAMARLGGEFAGIVRISLPDDGVAGLRSDLSALAERGIAVTMHAAGEANDVPGRPARFELTGSDHPGIVRDISAALARHGVSIDELETRVFPGSMSGEKLFSAEARIILPEGLSADDLRGELEAIAQDIMVEVEFKEVE